MPHSRASNVRYRFNIYFSLTFRKIRFRSRRSGSEIKIPENIDNMKIDILSLTTSFRNLFDGKMKLSFELLHHISSFQASHRRFDIASYERLHCAMATVEQEASPSLFPADNVGILCTMIHFSGVLIGKKTDKFYLLKKEERNLWVSVRWRERGASE